MSIHQAMQDACRAVGIDVPRRAIPGRWAYSPVTGKPRSNKSGRVMLNPDGRTGVAWNWATGEILRFSENGTADVAAMPAIKRDPETERRQEAERREIARACHRIVTACTPLVHPYLAAKGFPQEVGLVIDDLRPHLPAGDLGDGMAYALPRGEGPFLIVPGRIGKTVTTVQVITPEGEKKNIKGGVMSGAAYRIATGREKWVCEGIATALTVRAALRLLGRSATVLSAFSAHNVGRVASRLTGAVVAADHDKPLEQFGGIGTGEYYARQSGAKWIMPPAMGDFNDMHMSDGLRAVAMELREVRTG